MRAELALRTANLANWEFRGNFHEAGPPGTRQAKVHPREVKRESILGVPPIALPVSQHKS